MLKQRPVISALDNSTILVTGGTGSFGHCVAEKLISFNPKEIRIFSRDEQKQWEMRRKHPDLHFMLGDVRDFSALKQAIRGVDYVFHAAALKHVPELEDYPYEAIKTNILGSQNLCEAAMREDSVKSVVGLSTDKAVKPINAMGLSKAMMEKIFRSQNRKGEGPSFSCVRYGNVLGSRGSVFPLFKEQIAQGKPITITNPKMTRFLLTLDDALDLVAYAMTKAKGGEVFVRKAPACNMATFAKASLIVCGKHPEDYPIETVGTRKGEKLHEVLVNEYEMPRVSETETHFIIHADYANKQNSKAHPSGEEYTSENTKQITSPKELAEVLKNIGRVP